MSRRSTVLAQLDLDLLGELERGATLVAACQRLKIGRDRGVYRIRRLERALRRPVVATRHGGREPGRTELTSEGYRLLHTGMPGSDLGGGTPLGRVVTPGGLKGTWHAKPAPNVRVGGRLPLFVTFDAREGEEVQVAVDPEAVVLARRRFPSSARNVLAGRVRRIHQRGPGTGTSRRLLEIQVGRARLFAALTPAAVQDLHLAPGARAIVYVKATAVHRVAGAARRPSRERLRR